MKEYAPWLGYEPAYRHACNTYFAAIHLEASLPVSSSLQQYACSYNSAHTLPLHAAVSSITSKCIAGVLQEGTVKGAGLQMPLIAARIC